MRPRAAADPARLVRVEASGHSPASVTPNTTFDPVTLPPWRPGGCDLGVLDGALRQWATSPPLRVLAEASGWPWPDLAHTADTQELLDQLAELSAAWDFRAQKERNFIAGEPAEVGGQVIPDHLVLAAPTRWVWLAVTRWPVGHFRILSFCPAC